MVDPPGLEQSQPVLIIYTRRSAPQIDTLRIGIKFQIVLLGKMQKVLSR